MILKNEIERLYKAYSKQLFIYITRLVGSRESAEDILHDVFVRVINYSKNNIILEETEMAFLYRTAKNLSINYIKRNKNFSHQPVDETLLLFKKENIHTENSGSPENIIINDEMINALNEAVASLPIKYKSVLIMKKECSMSLKEIAHHHGISEKTVQRILIKSLYLLRKNMSSKGFYLYGLYFAYLIISFIETSPAKERWL